MTMKTTMILLVLLGGASQLPGQPTAEVPLPKVAPLAHWRVDFTPKKKKADKQGEEEESPLSGGPARIKSIEYLLTDKVGRITKEFDKGPKTISYWYGRYQLVQVPPSLVIRLSEIAGRAGGGQGIISQYPNLDWLTPDLYVGTVEAYGEKCRYFRKEQTLAELYQASEADLGKNPIVVWEAWVSVATNRPLAFSTPEQTEVFTFLPIPAGKVELPPEFQEFVDKNLTPRRPAKHE